MKKLELEFHDRMEEIYYRAKDEIDYPANRFKQMIDINGGYKAAKILLDSKELSDGFIELYNHNRLDLSMEALIVENLKFHELFTKDEIKIAKDRLIKCGYIPKIK